MIKYALKCAEGHVFDSWFQDSAAFDRLSDAGHLACAVCGGADVAKAIMAPQVSVPAKAGASEPAAEAAGPLSAPASPAEQALQKLRAHVEANSDNVGRNFASEARAIHEGEAPARSIYGEARLDEAKSLVEDGIPVAPLPWGNGKTN